MRVGRRLRDASGPRSDRPGPIPAVVMGALGLTSLVFGGNFVALELGLAHTGPMTLQAWAVLSATVVVAAVQVLQRRPLLLPADQLQVALPVSFLLTVVPSVGIVLGVERVSAGVSALVIALTPIVTVVLARVLGTSAVSRSQVIGVIVGLVGVGVVTVGQGDASVTRVVGILWLFVSAVSWAVGLQVTKQHSTGGDPFAFVAWQLGLGVPVMFLIAWFMEGLEADWTGALIIAVIWSGALSKGLGSVLQYLTTGWSSPVQSSLTAFLVPVVALTLSVPLLGARLGVEHLVGVSLVVLGVTLVRSSHGSDAKVEGTRPPRRIFGG